MALLMEALVGILNWGVLKAIFWNLHNNTISILETRRHAAIDMFHDLGQKTGHIDSVHDAHKTEIH
jgi:hypothetical protein